MSCVPHIEWAEEGIDSERGLGTLRQCRFRFPPLRSPVPGEGRLSSWKEPKPWCASAEFPLLPTYIQVSFRISDRPSPSSCRFACLMSPSRHVEGYLSRTMDMNHDVYHTDFFRSPLSLFCWRAWRPLLHKPLEPRRSTRLHRESRRYCWPFQSGNCRISMYYADVIPLGVKDLAAFCHRRRARHRRCRCMPVSVITPTRSSGILG